MPLFQEELNKNANPEKVAENQSPPNQQQKSGLLTIIGQLLPLAPFAFEQFTGQKVPPMTGTIADIQSALIQISTNLQTVVNNQQQFNQKLIALETKLSEIQTSANQQLTSLSQQFQSLRLTHTRERKEIEYNPNKQLETESY